MSSDNPTVWVVNDSGHPTWLAEQAVPGADIKPFSVQRELNPLRTDRCLDHFAEGIAKYVRPGDYLLISGTPMLNAIAVSLWLLRFKEVNILQWNALVKQYEKSTITEENALRLLEKYLFTQASL